MSERFPGGFITKTPVVPSGPYETSSASGIWTLDQQQQAQKAGIWPTAGNIQPDPYFEYVTMLLHGDGTNGGQNNTFVDSSTNNFSITRNGNTTQGSFSPYGTLWSNYFDGTGDYLVTPANTAFTFGTGDFTIECWVNSKSTPSYGFVWSVSSQTPSLQRYATNNTVLYSIGGTVLIASSAAVFDGLWHHVAVVKLSGVTTLYVDGVSQGTTSDATSLTGDTFYVGSWPGAAGYELNGYVSNIRVVKGTALYTSNFTPSTTPLTAVSGTSLLTCQSNRFIDNSSNNFTITRYGDTSVQRFSPFQPTAAYSTATIGGSGYFDGSGDYLTAPDNAAFEFGSGNFTIEAWAYPLDGGFQMLIAKSPDNQATGWQFFASGDELNFYASTGGSWNVGFFSSGAPIKRNAWNHLAVTRNGSTWTIWVNGVSQATTTSSITINNNTLPVAIGAFTNASYFSYGYTADVRIVKGTAVYTSNFTPPTAPLTAITNTSLLTSFTNGAIFDNAMMNDLETVGTAQISTSVVKYGTGSLAFDGTGDFLRPPLSPMASLGGNFTVEFWAYLNDQDAQDFVGTATWANYIGAGKSGWSVSYTSSSVSFSYQNNNSYVIATAFSGTTLSNSTWNHVAVVRDNGTIKCYVNGVASATTISSSTNFVSTTYGVWVGAAGDADTYGYELNGYLDDVRVTNGVARYTANFTPPTAAFQNF